MPQSTSASRDDKLEFVGLDGEGSLQYWEREQDGAGAGTFSTTFPITGGVASRGRQVFMTDVPVGMAEHERSMDRCEILSTTHNRARDAEGIDRDEEFTVGSCQGGRRFTRRGLEVTDGGQGGLIDAIRSFVSLHVTPSKVSVVASWTRSSGKQCSILPLSRAGKPALVIGNESVEPRTAMSSKAVVTLWRKSRTITRKMKKITAFVDLRLCFTLLRTLGYTPTKLVTDQTRTSPTVCCHAPTKVRRLQSTRASAHAIAHISPWTVTRLRHHFVEVCIPQL